MPFWRELGRGLSDVFFPPVCVHCGGLVEDSAYRHVCARCSRWIEFSRPPCCETCGHPLWGSPGDGRGCAHCEGLAPAFSRGQTAVLFRGPARSLILELKYHRRLHLLADAEEVFRRSPELLAAVRGAALVPVPLHPRKERERGFNQSALLAAALARASGSPSAPVRLLRRVEDTPSQTGHDRRSRMRRLKNAFALVPGEPLNVRLRLILVDDVFTTGSTLDSCARTLRRAGYADIEAIAFARG